ncbi:hypothetical protein GP486_001447 [Trichoglossum hirsutum]|uniref:VOC domain-containing protein n=1 Tax=Trichoglossum hirsutum TaxID=265104 RepID=A0A9P8LGT5_9PEZI|nr:hypothetical protein GP486_001447 [Trichoglossum hirsutum]
MSISVPGSKLDEVVAFYVKALEPLRYVEMMRFPGVVGLGADGVPDFWIGTQESAKGGETHIAFSAKERALVNSFHAAALKAGAENNGDPGPRPQYTPTYYSAYARDPMGNNVEVVCHCPEEAAKSQ